MKKPLYLASVLIIGIAIGIGISFFLKDMNKEILMQCKPDYIYKISRWGSYEFSSNFGKWIPFCPAKEGPLTLEKEITTKYISRCSYKSSEKDFTKQINFVQKFYSQQLIRKKPPFGSFSPTYNSCKLIDDIYK